MFKFRSLKFIGFLFAAWSACYGIPGYVSAASSGRVYEMASPVYKAGYGVATIAGVAPDGNKVAFTSIGAFEGAPAARLSNAYVASREGEGNLSGEGWVTASSNAPATTWPFSEVDDYSPDLRISLTKNMAGPNAGVLYEGNESEFLKLNTALPNIADNFEQVGPVLVLNKHNASFNVRYDIGDPAFSHVVFDVKPTQNLLPQAAGTESRLYDLSDAGLRLVGLNNKGKVISPCLLRDAGSFFGRASMLNAVSKDGQEVFFMDDATELNGQCAEHEQVFARMGGSRTLEVSRPLDASKKFGGCVGQSGGAPGEVPCVGAATREPAEYQGASEDGSKVFFTTSESLLPGQDLDSGNDLYMAKIECPDGGLEGCAPAAKEVKSLIQVSHGMEPAEVQGVVAISQDGSHVYFVAHGALSGKNSAGRTPLRGADNLYGYSPNSDSAPVFIADLCSGPEASGHVRQVACSSKAPSDDEQLWRLANREAQVNECVGDVTSCEDGRFLVFATYAKVLASDTDEAKDVYRYDALDGMLVRVSGGEDGHDANGNDDAYDATIRVGFEGGAVAAQHNLNSRAISEDGSRIVFFTAEPLSSVASNGLLNAYEWREDTSSEGSVTLVSTGNSDQPVDWAVISSNHRDIFFLTTQGLVAQDTDGQLDLYDAREGGGFASTESVTKSCSGDACQGPLTNPVPLLVPGSVSTIPGGNYVSSKAKPKKVLKKRRKRKTVRKKPQKQVRHIRHAVQNAGQA